MTAFNPAGIHPFIFSKRSWINWHYSCLYTPTSIVVPSTEAFRFVGKFATFNFTPCIFGVMQQCVNLFFKHYQILKSVVMLYSIYVMNNLVHSKVAFKILFHNKPMFYNITRPLFIWVVRTPNSYIPTRINVCHVPHTNRGLYPCQ